jgi:hypothetical protein
MNAVEHALRLAVEHTFIGALCTLTLFAILSPRSVSAEPKGQLYITKDRRASGGQPGRASQTVEYSLGRNAEAVARYEESYLDGDGRADLTVAGPSGLAILPRDPEGAVAPCCAPGHFEQLRTQMRHARSHGGMVGPAAGAQRPQDALRFAARRRSRAFDRASSNSAARFRADPTNTS